MYFVFVESVIVGNSSFFPRRHPNATVQPIPETRRFGIDRFPVETICVGNLAQLFSLGTLLSKSFYTVLRIVSEFIIYRIDWAVPGKRDWVLVTLTGPYYEERSHAIFYGRDLWYGE